MKKLYILILVTLILFSSGCNDNSQQAYTSNEVYQIIDETLTQAELTNQKILETMDNNVLNASLISWQHQPLEITTNEPNKLEVILQGEFILTDTTTTLPLTLTLKNSQWQTDNSFCPQEQPASDYYYTETELQNIVEDVLYRVDKVKNVYPVHDDISRDLFREVFLFETAGYYYSDFTNQNWEQLCQSSWQLYNCKVWLNTQDKIVLIMKNGNNTYRPLNIYKVDGQWLTDESYAAQGEFAAIPAILPFLMNDIQFPFDSHITPTQFTDIYGQPLNTETGEYLFDTDYTTYNYADFSITWINWQNSGHYTINNIATQTNDFLPEIRGIRLGDSLASVIKKFHYYKSYNNSNSVYEFSIFYGVYEHTADYGLIDNNTLVYVAGDKVINLTFVDDKLKQLEFQSIDN